MAQCSQFQSEFSDIYGKQLSEWEMLVVNTTGCAGNFLSITTALFAILFGYFSASSPTETLLDETEYPFALADEGVTYSFRENLNCQVVIAGSVEFLPNDLASHENIAIMIQQIGTYDDRSAAMREIRNDESFGENGWSILLVGRYSIQVWVQDLTSDVSLSAKVLVDGLDCQNARTLAVVNFRQIRPR
jgi:hypothetical protein